METRLLKFKGLNSSSFSFELFYRHISRTKYENHNKKISETVWLRGRLLNCMKALRKEATHITTTLCYRKGYEILNLRVV